MIFLVLESCYHPLLYIQVTISSSESDIKRTQSDSGDSSVSTSEDANEVNEVVQQDPEKNKVDKHSPNLEKYVKIFPWLYYHPVHKGYKCKTCEMFPPLLVAGGHSRHKFGGEAVKNLTDHPTRYLHGHQMSDKHKNATAQYEGKSINVGIACNRNIMGSQLPLF